MKILPFRPKTPPSWASRPTDASPAKPEGPASVPIILPQTFRLARIARFLAAHGYRLEPQRGILHITPVAGATK